MFPLTAGIILPVQTLGPTQLIQSFTGLTHPVQQHNHFLRPFIVVYVPVIIYSDRA